MQGNDSRFGIGPAAAWIGESTPLRMHAVLRTYPEDFMVTEVDAKGSVVPASSELAREMHYRHPEATGPKAKMEHAPVIVETKPLSDILDAATVAQLHALATVDTSNSTEATAKRIALGTITDKGQRGTLRCSIRHALPRLHVEADKDSGALAAAIDPLHAAMEEAAGGGDLGTDLAASIARYCIESNHDHSVAPVRQVLPEDLSKDSRRAIHAAIAAAYPYLDTKFSEGILNVVRRPLPSGSGARKRQKDGTRVTKSFTHFIVEKRNIDALEAKRHIAQRLRVNGPACIALAGMKDKRAVTWQRMSAPGDHRDFIKRNFAETLTPFKSSDGGAYVKVFTPQLEHGPIRLGDLSGNVFSIVLRRVHVNREDASDVATTEWQAALKARAERLRSTGFVNYFGPQRFGIIATRDDLPGLHILRGDYSAAVESVLRPLPGEGDGAVAAKKEYAQSRDAAAALKLAPRAARDLTELLLQLRHHQRAGLTGDALCRAALEGLNYDVKQMWLHAAQSFIFNEVASRRCAWKAAHGNTGLAITVGDWVQELGAAGDATAAADETPADETPADEAVGAEEDGDAEDARDGAPADAPAAANAAATAGPAGTTAKLPSKRAGAFERVTPALLRTIASQDPASPTRRFRIVGPLVGHLTSLVYDGALEPGTLLDDTVRAVLGDLGIPITSFVDAPIGVPLTGGLRPMIHVAGHLELGFAAPDGAQGVTHQKANCSIDVKLALPSSCYATVVLREILGAFPETASSAS